MKKHQIHYAWFIFISCCAIMVSGVGIVNSCSGLFFAPVSKALGVGVGDITLYQTIMYLVMIVTLPVAGKIMTKFDMRITLTIAFIIQCGTFGMLSQVTHVYQYYIAGVLLGICTPFILFLAVPVLINSWFKEKLGIALGLSMAFSGIGGAVFSPIGNYFITNFGWRNGYISLALIGSIIVLPFTIFVIRSKPSDKGLMPYGAKAMESKTNEVAKEVSGVMAKEAIKMPTFYIVLIYIALISIGVTVANHIPNFVASRGLPSNIGALGVTCVMIGLIVSKVIMGRLRDKFGIESAVFFGIIMGIIGCTVMLLSSGSYMILIGSFLLGISAALGTFTPPLVTRSIFGSRDYSSIYSYVSVMVSIICAFIISAFGFIYDITGSYSINFIIVGIAFLLASLAITAAFKSAKKNNLGDY
jgi:MFS family permease